MIKPMVGAGSQHMSAAKDNNGTWLDGGKNYRLPVPANVLTPYRLLKWSRMLLVMLREQAGA